jgi:hypothetical protein
MRNHRNHSFLIVFEREWKLVLCEVGVVLLMAVSVGPALAANVTVNVTSNLFPVASTAYGMHTSVYDNQNGNAALPSRLIESGVSTLRYSGGGYADVFHWSVNKLSPWQDGSYGYQGPNTDFGHFVGLLDSAHAHAVITINFGSGQLWNAGHTQLVAPSTNAEPPEAAAWVAYANGNAALYDTPNDIALGTDSQGNNWRTAGFWAKLRSSSQSVYQTWATTDGVYDATFNFLAINHPAPVGIKYWEIGNETFGTGYYSGNGSGNGYSVNYAVPYPYTTNPRVGNPALSPANYGQQVKAFSLAMKAVDPTIKIGAVVSTPLGDYSWDVFGGQHWTPQVLAQCATNIDFIIAHWYFYNGNNDNGSSLLPSVAANIPSMINGTGSHTGTSSGLKDWINQYRPADPTNVSIFITEFGYTGSITNTLLGPVTALFDADSYSTWMSYGVSNICFLEMNKTPFLGDSSSLTRGETFFAIKLLHAMAAPGDMYVQTTSDTSTVRVHAALQQSGNVGLVLLNENNENRTGNQTVNVAISNAALSPLGTEYQFGTNNFTGMQETPTSTPSSNSVFGLGNSFSITLPAYTMAVLTIPIVGSTPTSVVGLSSSVNPSTYGSPVTFTVTVQTNGVALGGIAGDMVTFLNGAVPLGTVTVNASGQAAFITSATQLPAGADFITAVYDGDPVYSPSTNSSALSQAVNQATLTAGLTGTVSKNYNGTTTATLAAGNYTLSGVFNGDTVTVNNTTGTYDTRNQGTGKTVTVTGLAISGSSATNYNLANTAVAAAVGTINKTNITVTAAANTKFYDTTLSAAATPNVTSGGVQAGDTAGFVESYTTQNAGTGKTLTPSGTVTDGNSGNNYNYSFIASANGTINPAPVTVVSGIGADSKVYDGTTAATISSNNVLLSGMLGGDANNVALSTNGYMATFATANVGTGIAVTVSNLSLTGTAAGNYTVVPPAGLTADILPLVTPVLNAISNASGTVQIEFSGQPGQKYRVLATDDLTLPLNQWTVTASGTFGSDPAVFMDRSNLPGRFYRIVSP